MHNDLVSLVRQHAAERGGQPAFTFVRDEWRILHETTLGFAELDRRARVVAARLQVLGLWDRAVLLLYPEGLDFLVAFLGCLYARVVAVPAPLPELDAARSARTRRIIRDADITLILTTSTHQERLRGWLDDSPSTSHVRLLATDTHITAHTAMAAHADPADPAHRELDDWSPPDIGPATVAVLQYTSGSTSDPKGVIVTHGNLVHNAEEIRRCIHGSPETIGVGWIPHYHDMGLIGQLVSPLYLGCHFVFTSPITFLKRPAIWLELISRHRATNTVAPNFGYDLLCRRVTDNQLTGLDLSSLRTAQNGAEPLRAETLTRMTARFASIGLRPEVMAPCYGMAESTLLITGTRPGTGPVMNDFSTAALTHHHAIPVPAGTADSRRLVSSGRPVTLDVRIVDPNTQQPLPDRRVGEIWVRGGSVTHGYWRRPRQTDDTFHATTNDGEGPYLCTGDLGFLSAGELYVTGRIKDLIIVNGTNIYAHDLEEAAQAAHPAARAAAAFTIDIGHNTGPEQVILLQEINPRAANGTPLSDLAALTRDTVSRAFGLPALSVVLCSRGSVERTTSGKIQRHLTRNAFLAGTITSLADDLHPDIAALLSPRVAGPVIRSAVLTGGGQDRDRGVAALPYQAAPTCDPPPLA